jgi:putative glutamine amidotransferase
MRFLLTGGTLNPLKAYYADVLARYGHESAIVYPGEPVPSADGYDVLLLPGGGDIDPARFGSRPLENGSETFDLPRDGLEFAVLEDFLRLQKPVIGICRGMQVLNVAFGGTLWQDIPSQLGLRHTAPEGAPPMEHTVCFAGGTDYTVNSYHHQAVRNAGRGLRVAAKSADGVIEALEHETLMIKAVQWHPERGCWGMEYLLERLNV